MGQYWLGDAHLGHLKVANIRGFETPEAHDETLMEQLSKLTADDTIFFLGDLCSGRAGSEERALEMISTVKAEKHLLAGNHDSVSSIHKNGWKSQKRYLQVFDSVRDFARISMGNETVLMSHYPYAAMGDGDGRTSNPRYLAYRLPDVGLPLIHAHTHQVHPFSLLRDETIHPVAFDGYDLNSMCVSWDARRGLTTEADVAKWIEVRSKVKKQIESERVLNYWRAFPKPAAAVAAQ